MSVPDGTARSTHTVSNPERDWWRRKKTSGIAAWGANPTRRSSTYRTIEEVRTSATDPPGRTYRQLTKAGELWCPVQGCEPFNTISQGPARRAHFVHKNRPDTEIHRGGPDLFWHQQAKLAIHDWLAGISPPCSNSSTHTCRAFAMAGGATNLTSTWSLKTGRRVVECQQQSMAGTDPADHRAQWQNRVDDYCELRESIGLSVVWLVSPWATTANTKYIDDGVWRVEVFGSYAASMINDGETVYWIDPTFSQIGTLAQHISNKREPCLPRGYLQRTTTVVDGRMVWLHSDSIINCAIDRITGTVTTPTYLKFQDDQEMADLHARLKADRERARIEEEQQRKSEAEARPDGPSTTSVNAPAGTRQVRCRVAPAAG